MTHRLAGLACFVLLAAAAACGPAAAPTPAAPTATPAGPARAATLRFEMEAEISDAIDMPRYLAIEALRAQGYTVETITLDDDSLAFVAMQQDELDITTAADVLGWRAITEGAPVFVALDETANTLLLAAVGDIQECADLDGRRVAINNRTGANATMLYRYIENNCPGVAPEYLVISGGSSRLAALLAGEVDAASTSTFLYLTLEGKEAAGLHPLVWYADEFPGLSTISMFMRRGLAEEYPETVKDVIRAVLEARRRIQDPQVLTGEIIARLSFEPDAARQIADTLLERKVWDVNGGYTLDALQQKIDWYAASGDLPADLQAADVADLSYLDAVLDEIGRQ